MNKEDLLEITKIVTKATDDAASNAVAKLHEFHQDNLKVLRERMDMGFESVDRRFDAVDARMDKIDERFDRMDQRFDQVESVLATLLKEFKQHQEDVAELKKENQRLTLRVQALEQQLSQI